MDPTRTNNDPQSPSRKLQVHPRPRAWTSAVSLFSLCANGSGKSNILEAIALGSAAAQYKLDNEFLISRGIRVTETRFMRFCIRRAPIVPPCPSHLARQTGHRGDSPARRIHHDLGSRRQ